MDNAQVAGDEEFVEKPDPVTLMPDLYDAAKTNDFDLVTRLLNDDVPPTFLDEVSGLTALHWAAMSGNVAMVRLLLAKGASINYARATKVRAAQRAAAAALSSGNTTRNSARRTSESSIPEDAGDDYSASRDEKNNKSVTSVTAADAIDEDEVEIVMPYLTNTPLLWAAFKGHLRVVWLLLIDGYSPNDLDDMANNALHLAAVNQHTQILKVLIDDGGSANAVNFYKNRPVDMATKREIRDMLAVAMVEGASYTDADVARKHAANMQNFNKYTMALQHAIAESKKIENSRFNISSINIPELIAMLSTALRDAEDWSLDEEDCAHAAALKTKLEAIQDLAHDTTQLQKSLPLKTQNEYIQYVHRLEKSMERARAVGLDRSQLQMSTDLISRANVEYWVETMANRLRAVPIAKDCHEHDMNRLRAAILKAQALNASESIIDSASILHGRLHTELGLYRAMQNLPAVRLPMENPPDGYFQECDTGHIEETEGYPLPPADTGVYIWVHAESFSGLQSAIDTLKKILAATAAVPAANDGEVVNPSLVVEAKEKLLRAEKEMKQLVIKDEADKNLAIEAATKLAKKLKKKGSPKKKKE